MSNKKFVILTERGFYKDYVTELFTDREGAHEFSTQEKALHILSALKSYRHILHGEVIEEPYDYATDTDELIDLARKYVSEAQENAAANPASKEIQIVVVEPKKKPYKKIIPNTLEAFQKIVGGYIENITINRTHTGAMIGILLNEEGKLKGLPFNRQITYNGFSDILVGTFFITAYNMEGDNVSLTDIDAEKYIKHFEGLEVNLIYKK
jgi:Domain of unknown function (DUF3846)